MKQRTKKAAQKRFKITKRGKLIREHAYSSHLKSKKSASRKRKQKEPTLISKSDKARIKRLLVR